MRNWVFRYVDADLCRHHPVHMPKAFEYAKAMEAGATFPPVKIHINKQGQYEVKDGAHRTTAAKLCSLPLLIKVASQFDHRSDIEIETDDLPSRESFHKRLD